jgi:hypothetical protein
LPLSMIFFAYVAAFGQSLRQMYCSARSASAEPFVARPLSELPHDGGQRGFGSSRPSRSARTPAPAAYAAECRLVLRREHERTSP